MVQAVYSGQTKSILEAAIYHTAFKKSFIRGQTGLHRTLIYRWKGLFYPLHEVLAGLDQSLVVCLLHDAEERVIPKPELSKVNSMTALRRLSSGYWGSRKVEQVSALLWFLLSINERGGIKPLPQVYNRFKEHAQHSIVKRDIQFAHMAKSAFASWLPANVSYEFVFRSADLSPVNRVLASAQESPKETCLAHLNIFMLLYTDGLMGMRRDFLDRCYVDAFFGCWC